MGLCIIVKVCLFGYDICVIGCGKVGYCWLVIGEMDEVIFDGCNGCLL